MSKTLAKEFPDLSESILSNVVNTCGNEEQAKQVLLATQEEQHDKIKEVASQFDLLSVADIRAILKQHSWSVDNALIELFEAQQQAATKKNASQHKAEMLQQKEEERKYHVAHLVEMFNNLSKDTIQDILDKNEGDLDLTIQALSEIIEEENRKKEAQKKKDTLEQERMRLQQEQEMQSWKLEALKQRFLELSVDQHIKPALQKCNWEIKEACKQLVLIDNDRKKGQLKTGFPEMPDQYIEDALKDTEWNTEQAYQRLVQLRQQLKDEQVAKEKASQPRQSLEQSIIQFSEAITNEIHTSIIVNQTKKEAENKKAVNQKLEEILKVQLNDPRNGSLPGLFPPPLPKVVKVTDVSAIPEPPVSDFVEKPKEEVIAPPEEQAVPTAVKDNKLQVQLKASPAVVDYSQTITVEYQIENGNATSWDWIGIYAPNTPNKKYLTYQRVNNLQKGAVTFSAPSDYGEYEFRFFASGSYEHLAMSNKITVGPQFVVNATLDEAAKKITVNWSQSSGNTYNKAWIGLYEKNQPNKTYLKWDHAGMGQVVFEAPVKPGEYECRFFSYSYFDVARSNPVRIEGADKLEVAYDGTSVTCKVNIVTVNPAVDYIWVGLYATDAPETKNYVKYKKVYDRYADVVFKTTFKKAGTYEARLFANTAEPLLKSNPFTVVL